MMKQILALLCCLLLAIPVLAETPEEWTLNEEEIDILNAYSGVIGRVAFSLPGPVQRLHDADRPGYWRDSVQLFGNTPDGHEFQFRTANLSERLEKELSKAETESDPLLVRANTLFDYAMLMPFSFDAKPNNQGASMQNDLLKVYADFTYPDSPGINYRCEAVLYENTALVLIGEVCPMLNEAYNRLKLLPEEEAEIWHSQPSSPLVTGMLGFLFPCKPNITESENSTTMTCMTADLSQIYVQFLPLGLEMPHDAPDLPEMLKEIAEKNMIGAVNGERVYDGMVEFPAEDCVSYSFKTISTKPFGEAFGQAFLCRMYVSPRGIHYIWTAEGEVGQTFLDSITVIKTHPASRLRHKNLIV